MLRHLIKHSKFRRLKSKFIFPVSLWIPLPGIVIHQYIKYVLYLKNKSFKVQNQRFFFQIANRIFTYFYVISLALTLFQCKRKNLAVKSHSLSNRMYHLIFVSQILKCILKDLTHRKSKVFLTNLVFLIYLNLIISVYIVCFN